MDERYARGLRRSPFTLLTEEEIEGLKEDIAAIGADERVFLFNEGSFTCYVDRTDTIFVKGNIFPDGDYSNHPRDLMSARAALAHEYYGHRAMRGTSLQRSSWNDEFRASYLAAKNAPGLTEQDKRHLILYAMERAKEAGVTIKLNRFMRGVLYGFNIIGEGEKNNQ